MNTEREFLYKELTGEIIESVRGVHNIIYMDDVHRAQLLNYLRISGLRAGLLKNFTKPKLQYPVKYGADAG